MSGYSAIGLINTKIEANVGGALRAAYCYGVSLVALQGKRFKKIPTDTYATHKQIPLIQSENIFDVVPYDCIPIAIEINDRAINLKSFSHPKRAFYIFGPEDGSIPNEVMNRCKQIVKIPTNGCMNLAATVNVVLYDRLTK